jgi:hypothetical protein
MATMTSALTLKDRFLKLTATWKAECAVMSSIRDIVLHPCYQQIIGMGPEAIPIILEEMRRSPHHWSWALRAITGEDPVLKEHKGKLVLMAEDWTRWGQENGYLA